MNDYLEAVEPCRPVAPYIGGKRALAQTIIKRIAEMDHVTYAEPFVGMGGIFFRRELMPRAEVVNDRNGEVVNLFRVLQRHYPAFMDFLKYQLTSRREFERLKKLDVSTLTDLERAARFLYLQRTAYGGKVTGQNFGTATGRTARFDYSELGALLEAVFERLSRVVIENLDWAEFMAKYDAPGTLFYLDPPYWGSENDYGRDVFARERFAEMAALMAGLKGQAILSLNDTPEVRETFSAFRFEEVSLTYSIGQAAGGPTDARELLIYTFERPETGLFG